ncbi:hypothetical protein SF274771_3159 [Shigella flexneri 2747-71]|nr:hypothetical protein SF274771_3159 [Shigella flexneri 2747-71]KFZ97066.1 hypothetical protein DP20_2739 [Shigella flexneri]
MRLKHRHYWGYPDYVLQCAAFSILICVGAENKLTHTSLFYGTKCNVLRFCVAGLSLSRLNTLDQHTVS